MHEAKRQPTYEEAVLECSFALEEAKGARSYVKAATEAGSSESVHEAGVAVLAMRIAYEAKVELTARLFGLYAVDVDADVEKACGKGEDDAGDR